MTGPRRRGRPRGELGELQLAVLDDLWDAGESTVREVAARFAARGQDLAYTTLLTTMARLTERGLLARRAQGRSHRYRVVIARAELSATLSRQAIDRLLATHGEAAISAFAARMREGDRAELARLRDLLAEDAE